MKRATAGRVLTGRLVRDEDRDVWREEEPEDFTLEDLPKPVQQADSVRSSDSDARPVSTTGHD